MDGLGDLLSESGPDSGGRLYQNIMYFARCLRAAGMPIGPGAVLNALQAVQAVGIENRRDFYWTLHAVFVNKHDQEQIFDQAFHIFWRNPQLLEKMMALMLPGFAPEEPEKGEEMNRRLAEALQGDNEKEAKEGETEIELDSTMTYSAQEALRDMDFEKMSNAEVNQAKRALERMSLPLADLKTRRFASDPRGSRVDLRATMRAQLRSGALIALRRKKQRTRPPPLVILCDISGSMSRYSRIFLHFMHAVTNDRDRVFTFLFGTRLSNVTRYLRYKDVDVALDKVAQAVDDWSGGTRIGQCLADFNHNWSRRVLGQGAIVVLITDGLDRDAGAGISQEIERLHKSCRRLIWLNPLLRYEGFAPKSLGMRAILPHVDEFRPVHSLDSIAELVKALSKPGPRRLEAASAWREAG
ncbi:MAG TPA: VWA domain-containing protein [Stellaceae bacterium]|nr:VWA domain-containing protein [Stellaceae bacterium]